MPGASFYCTMVDQNNQGSDLRPPDWTMEDTDDNRMQPISTLSRTQITSDPIGRITIALINHLIAPKQPILPLFLQSPAAIMASPSNLAFQHSRESKQEIDPPIRARTCVEEENRHCSSVSGNSDGFEGAAEATKDRPSYFLAKRHLARKEEILNIIEPILDCTQPDSLAVLLCWGNQDHCSIKPSRVSDSTADIRTWQEIREAWYAERGYWRKYVPMYGVRDIKITGCRGPLDRRLNSGALFSGFYTIDAINHERKRLQEIIASYETELDKTWCYYDSSTGFTKHTYSESVTSPECPEQCPEAGSFHFRRELLQLNTRSFLRHAFLDPHVSVTNNLLEDALYSHRNLLSKVDSWHHPKMGEIDFKGLLIEEGWGLDSCHVVVPLFSTVCFVMAIVAKVIYGDWATAWQVVGCIVALVTLAWMWLNHATS
ncbi:hypothetical protein BJ170DRAFT_75075 [Xylariales sp. AK1849]|nr:hypothetical protein BJ170DRAFT_75075 [Xylariales sp. AK1849]